MSLGVLIGATGGIGLACAHRLDGSTDRMLLVSRTEARLRAAASQLSAGSVVMAADIGRTDAHDPIVKWVRDSGEEIAWLVLASGVPLRGSLVSQSADAILETLSTNLVGPTLLIRRLLDCRWREDARIVIIGSISASRALPNRSVYSASKAGLEQLARSLAAELAPMGIRVNVVAPGVIDTAFLGDDRSALDAWIRQRVPMKRTGTAEEVADVVRYLAIEAPAYLTGARIAIDGGAESVA